MSSTDLLPLIVKPAMARKLLSCSEKRLYQLLNAGLLASFKDGRSRKITTESIKAYIAKKLAETPQ